MSYVPLWCKSNFSFLEGASHPEELVEQAHLYGLQSLAITDRAGVYGLPKAWQKCCELGGKLRLICGAQIEVMIKPNLLDKILLFALNRAGWTQLCGLLSLGASRASKGRCLLRPEDVADSARDLLAIWLGPKGGYSDSSWLSWGGLWSEAFRDRIYLGLARHQQLQERRLEVQLHERASRLDIPIVAVREVLYHDSKRQRLQDLLCCLRHKRTLVQAGTILRPSSDFALLDKACFLARYADQPDAIARTLEIAERCRFSLDELSYRYPDEPLPDGKTSAGWLRELAFAGAFKRYDASTLPAVEAQLNKELQVITDLGYVGYFLTMYEIVEYCRSQGILCQGRGSAANSIVCYCLGITAVDPYKLDLLFERFISKERAEPPDIDLDIMHQRREEVISWVYKRYGRERAAMVCNVVRYRSRLAVREVGKVLGVELPAIERLVKLVTSASAAWSEEIIEAAGLPSKAPLYRLLLELSREIVDFPRHLSVHPGGFILGSEPISHLVPTEKAAMEGRTVIQWDKYDVEALGLFKVDLLGLGALSQLDRAFKLIEKTRSLKLSLDNLPASDEQTFAMLSEGDSIGVFQVESRAQISLLPVLRPNRFYDLVIQIAIVRPGPITGGMIHPYLRRRQGEEAVSYPHVALQPVLEKTLGIPLFQEQVMRLAVVAADYTPGEADQLRRDMAAWKSHGKLERHQQRLVTRMLAKGIERKFAEQVFEQIKGFGEYGFPESHAASFALITYATSYLRCHFLPEFICSLLNSQPMGFYSCSTILEDARRKGLQILPFSCEHSQWESSLERMEDSAYPFALRLGFKLIKGLSEKVVAEIIVNRPYASTRDLAIRASLTRKTLELLATCGATEAYGKDRRSELWDVEEHILAQAMPLLARYEKEERYDFALLSSKEKVIWDFETSGLSPYGHPMQGLRGRLRELGNLCAKELSALPDKAWARVTAMVICRQRPHTANGTVFLTLEDETGLINVILWPRVFQEHLVLVRTSGLIAVEGIVQKKRAVVHLVARKLSRPSLETPVELSCRSFH